MTPYRLGMIRALRRMFVRPIDRPRVTLGIGDAEILNPIIVPMYTKTIKKTIKQMVPQYDTRILEGLSALAKGKGAFVTEASFSRTGYMGEGIQ